MFTRNRVIISDFFQDHEKYLNTTINVCGWAHLIRKQGTMLFILLNDGSTAKNIRDVIPYPRYPKHCNQ